MPAHADAEYRVGETLGQGAVAEVARVTRVADGAVFAGKILHASHGQDPTAVARFMQEAELLRDLDHDNVVGVHGVVELGGRSVLLMELVEGSTLEQLIARDAPLPEARIATIGRGIAAGLSRAHAAGIIHRDLKPANVLMAAGDVPKIADFGMARATSFSGVDRKAMTVLGTPDYMAPESLDPLAVDPRSDLYALGCILFEMATGRPPFTAATPFGVIEQHRSAPLPEVPRGLTPGMRALIESLLAKSPADRPQAAATVADLLQEIGSRQDEAPITALARTEDDMARCAGCSQPLILEIGVCMNCGLATARVEKGRCALLVTGPGQPGDKFDSELRGRLVDWIRKNPGLHMDPGSLAKKIPRMPFTLATRISRESAEAIGQSLGRLGIEHEIVTGAALRSKAMRKKAWTMAGRALAIVAAFTGVVAREWFLLVALPTIMLGIMGGMVWHSARRKTRSLRGENEALQPALAAAVRRVESSLPAVDAPRHRHGLRAAVSRALVLAKTEATDEETVAELAQAVDLATIAAGRLSALDRELQTRDLREAGAEERAMLHERDLWAARLLDLTASLDAFQARVASARAQARSAAPSASADTQGRLEDLRLRIEALEEIRTEVESQ